MESVALTKIPYRAASRYLHSIAYVMLLYSIPYFSMYQPKPFQLCCSHTEWHTKLADNQYSLVLSSWEDLCHRIVSYHLATV